MESLHSGSRRWLRRATLAAALAVCLVFLLAGAGAAYQLIAGARDRHSHPAPGTMIDVGGFRMHLYCAGNGPLTVILDSGLSDTSLHWNKVQPQVAQFTRVCSYDRAGLGWSEPSPRARTSRVIAEELHGLLQKAQVPPPYVLVGHSMGGLNVRAYASMYPSEVRGMVLVDASHPQQYERLPQGPNPWMQSILWQKRLMIFGIPRLLDQCGHGMEEAQPAFRAYDCTVQQKQGWLAEEDSIAESWRQVVATGSLGDMPLIVLSHEPTGAPQFEVPWAQMQEELARLSTRGVRRVAQGSGHHIHRERPDLVIGAIREVVSQSKAAL